jgi:hypothetical protein
MTLCNRCGTITEGGQLYCFHYGVYDMSSETGPGYREHGSEEVYCCDRCVVQPLMRGAALRSGFYLLLGLFALVVAAVGAVRAAGAVGAVPALCVFLVIALLGGSAFRRYCKLRSAVRGDPIKLREFVSADEELQERGDEWAIAHRRAALQEEGATAFLTRSWYAYWSGRVESR